MIKFFAIPTILFFTAVVSSAQHIHGEGALDIAIYREVIFMELTVSANDIVGFEHEPKTTSEKAAVADAINILQENFLFEFDRNTGCVHTDGSAEFQVDGDHAEFFAEHNFDCVDTDRLQYIETKYFAIYPETHDLETTIAKDGDNAKVYEWSSKNDRLNL